MTADLREDQLRVLRSLFDSLGAAVPGKRKGRDCSLLVRLLSTTENSRRAALRCATVNTGKVGLELLTFLRDSGYIREADLPGEYTLSARGIWAVESRAHDLDVDDLVAELDSKYFDVFESSSSISGRHRVILLTMISTRAFCLAHPVDLYAGAAILDGWSLATTLVSEFLARWKLIDPDVSSNILSGKTEHPVSNLFRHSEDLPKDTRGVFKAPGRQKYFLDVFDGKDIDTEKLAYVVSLIFSGEFSVDLVESIQGLCRESWGQFSTTLFPLSSAGQALAHPRTQGCRSVR